MQSADFEHIRDATTAAIRQAMEEILVSNQRSDLFGFALCTDDDVMTLYHVFATRAWVAVREPDYPDIGYIAVEWVQTAQDGEFREISKALRRWSDADGTPAGIESRFGSLVAAMQACRDAGLFDADTFLFVGSTDPGACSQAMAREAIEAFNTPRVALTANGIL